MSPPQLFGGIDVAKAPLDIAVRPTGDRWTVTNDEAGIAALVVHLQAMAPTCWCSKRPEASSEPSLLC